jgi:hypothetical protein
VTPLLCSARPCCQSCNFHNPQENVKIIERIKIIPKRVMEIFSHLRAKFELEKSYFDLLAIINLEVSNTKPRATKNIASNLKCKPFTQARCDGSRQQEFLACPCPKWEFLEFFSFLSFFFIFPVSIPTSMTGKPTWPPSVSRHLKAPYDRPKFSEPSHAAIGRAGKSGLIGQLYHSSSSRLAGDSNFK